MLINLKEKLFLLSGFIELNKPFQKTLFFKYVIIVFN